MMQEWDWYEKTEELLHKSIRGDWNKLVFRAIEVYQHYKINPEMTEEQITEALHGLLRKLQGFPPTWLIISAPDGEIRTPEDLSIEPAWNVFEIQHLWDIHDGRNMGTMVVGVYVWNFESQSWSRDRNWGVMGDERATGPADETRDAFGE
jgi:hypothetical protein